jgi:hypothetical protein
MQAEAERAIDRSLSRSNAATRCIYGRAVSWETCPAGDDDYSLSRSTR